MDARMLSSPISSLNPQQPCCVELGTSVSKAVDQMQAGRFGCVLVVDREEQLVGIITDRDLLVHIMGKRLDPADVTVEEIMTPSPEALRASDPIAFALNRMHLGGFRHIPLLVYDDKHGYPVGIVSSKDFANHVAKFLEDNP
jgi:CBS domain-containing protein